MNDPLQNSHILKQIMLKKFKKAIQRIFITKYVLGIAMVVQAIALGVNKPPENR